VLRHRRRYSQGAQNRDAKGVEEMEKGKCRRGNPTAPSPNSYGTSLSATVLDA